MPEKEVTNSGVIAIIGTGATVLGAIALFVFTTWVGGVNSSLAEQDKAAQAIDRRLTTVEVNLSYIASGIARIETNTKATSAKVGEIRETQIVLKNKVDQLPSMRTSQP